MQSRFQVVGPLARAVGDLALAFDVLCPEADAAPFDAAPDPAALRIGWTAATELGPVRGELVAALSDAAAGLGAAEVATELSAALDAYNAYRDLDPLVDHLEAVRGREALVSPGALAALSASTGAAAADLAAARERAEAVRASTLRLFENVDVLLLPVAGGPACLPDGSLDVDGERVDGWRLMAHCRAVTLLGAPSVSVPVGVSAEGLPLSVQVVAAPGRDRLALAVAGVL
jgi:amidase